MDSDKNYNSLKVYSHLLLLGKFLWVQSRHFIRNSCHLKFQIHEEERFQYVEYAMDLSWSSGLTCVDQQQLFRLKVTYVCAVLATLFTLENGDILPAKYCLNFGNVTTL